MVKRNIFNKVEYSLNNARGICFFVECSRGGNYTINQRGPWYITRARLAMGPWDPFGDIIPAFDSFARAAAFLKNNINDLI